MTRWVAHIAVVSMHGKTENQAETANVMPRVWPPGMELLDITSHESGRMRACGTGRPP